MPKIKKSVLPQNLASYQVFIEDTDPFSQYFKIAELPTAFQGGKNAFLINGSTQLIPTTDVLVELIDSTGNTVFIQPIRYYQEGLARVVSVEIYEDTPPGPALLIVMGEASVRVDGTPIPSAWKDKYNVRWTKQINISPNAVNTNKVRLYQRPIIEVSEILTRYRNAITGSDITMSGSASLITVATAGPTSSIPTYIMNSFTFPLSSSMDGGTVYAPNYQYTSSIVRVLNSSSAQVDTAYGPLNSGFSLTNIQLVYTPPPTFEITALTRSFADVKVRRLTTFSGDINRSKIYVKSLDQPGDYQLVDDIRLESVELLTTTSIETGQDDLAIGYFTSQSIINKYWEVGIANFQTGYVTSSVVTASYETARLIDAVHLIGDSTLYTAGDIHPRYFIATITPLVFTQGMEYTFQANVACYKADPNFIAQMDVYVSGAAFPSTNPLGYRLQSYVVEGGKSFTLFDQNTFNFYAIEDGTADLYFVIYGGDWHIAKASIGSSKETGFNPDEVRVVAPIINRRYERLIFKAELFDPNSSIVPILIESDPVFFDGGNVVFKGYDHRIEGQMTVVPKDAREELTGIHITTEGFIGTNPYPGFISGSSIYIGQGEVFNKNTPFFVGSNYDGKPLISMGDKLLGYIDPVTGDFVLKIYGSIFIGSGSNFVDIRNLFGGGQTSNARFDAIFADQGQFIDVRGTDSVKAGIWNEEISRMGHYTRGYSPPIYQPPLVLSGSLSQIDPATGSFTILAISGSLPVPTGSVVKDNTIYGTLNITLNQLDVPPNVYVAQYGLEVLTSWTGFLDPVTNTGQSIMLNNSLFITTQSDYSPPDIIDYPIFLPVPQTGNTVYVVTKLKINVVPTGA